MRTVVIQSFRTHDVPQWLALCMNSVQHWTLANSWHYICMDDQFFDFAPTWAKQRCGSNIYAITDICRLQWMHRLLAQDFERVVWVDADVLIFSPDKLDITTQRGHAFAYELFLRLDNSLEGFTALESVNNSFMTFERRGQTTLSDYLNAALKCIRDAQPGPIPRTALLPSNLETFRPDNSETLAGIGLFTLGLMKVIAEGGGELTQSYRQRSPAPLGAANLCHFLRNSTDPVQRPNFDKLYLLAVQRLLATKALP